MRTNNLFASTASGGDGEMFDELLRGSEFKLERIVSLGQATPVENVRPGVARMGRAAVGIGGRIDRRRAHCENISARRFRRDSCPLSSSRRMDRRGRT